MELTDVAVITKADGDLVAAAGRAASDCANALRLMRPRSHLWQAVVRSCSALTGEGIPEVLAVMNDYESTMRAGTELDARRQAQASDWLRSEITEQLISRFTADENVQRQWQALDEQVRDGDLPASGAAQQVVGVFLGEEAMGQGKANEGEK
jgi:LAO/AO transport system kinase